MAIADVGPWLGALPTLPRLAALRLPELADIEEAAGALARCSALRRLEAGFALGPAGDEHEVNRFACAPACEQLLREAAEAERAAAGLARLASLPGVRELRLCFSSRLGAPPNFEYERALAAPREACVAALLERLRRQPRAEAAAGLLRLELEVRVALPREGAARLAAAAAALGAASPALSAALHCGAPLAAAPEAGTAAAPQARALAPLGAAGASEADAADAAPAPPATELALAAAVAECLEQRARRAAARGPCCAEYPCCLCGSRFDGPRRLWV